MDALSPPQHLEVLGDAPGASFGAFGVVDAPDALYDWGRRQRLGVLNGRSLLPPSLADRAPQAALALAGFVVLASAVWSFASTIPLFRRKLSRCGICSRSDGTFGLSRRKCVLSNWM